MMMMVVESRMDGAEAKMRLAPRAESRRPQANADYRHPMPVFSKGCFCAKSHTKNHPPTRAPLFIDFHLLAKTRGGQESSEQHSNRSHALIFSRP